MREIKEYLQTLLLELYDQAQVEDLLNAIWHRVEIFRKQNPQYQSSMPPTDPFTERDVLLISYADQFKEPDRFPLQSLVKFLKTNLQDVVNGIHILPFYPFSSDDGFSVIDYLQVSPALGSWQDISLLEENYSLTFDLVINHVSSQSSWFQSFLKGERPYTDYFIVIDPDTDLSRVVRPRSTPVLTPFQTSRGRVYVWTTFSPDQIDLNYGNPQVLLKIIEVLLFYVAHGAQIIRLDAIAYLWKIPDTSCIHLPQTHNVVKVLRAVLDAAAPSVLLLTETNVPHKENISYFGNYLLRKRRTDEAQMVYQFPLAPLLLHTFITGKVARLSEWAKGLSELMPGTTFLNFTATHDGIGIRPAEGLLDPNEIQALVERTLSHGGFISYGAGPESSQIPYELNITWYDALNDPSRPDMALDIHRFLASQAILLSLAGIPGIYIHNLLGSRNCLECLHETGRARSINREKFLLADLQRELNDPHHLKSRVLAGVRHLLKVRTEQPAFHPEARQQILDLGPGIFANLRISKDGDPLICLTNVTAKELQTDIQLPEPNLQGTTKWLDLLTKDAFSEDQRKGIGLGPYQSRWLRSA